MCMPHKAIQYKELGEMSELKAAFYTCNLQYVNKMVNMT